jgi:hypothetical protein
MRLVEYHKLRRAVQVNARPGAQPDLRTLEERLRDALAAAGFADVEVGATDDPDRLVIGLCSFPARYPVQDVAEVLERLWQDHLRYGFWEAHTTLVESDQVELLAATRAGASGHYATLHVVAQRTAVPAQRTSST